MWWLEVAVDDTMAKAGREERGREGEGEGRKEKEEMERLFYKMDEGDKREICTNLEINPMAHSVQVTQVISKRLIRCTRPIYGHMDKHDLGHPI